MKDKTQLTIIVRSPRVQRRHMRRLTMARIAYGLLFIVGLLAPSPLPHLWT